MALGVIAIDLLGYALWRAYEAILDPERVGSDWAGIGQRVGWGLRAISYGALALGAGKMALGTAGSSSADNQEQLAARVMALPFGRWLIIGVGVFLIGYGLNRLYRAWQADLDDKLQLGELSSPARRWVTHLSRFGIGARGVVFAIIGWFLVQAGIEHAPRAAGGTSEALKAVQATEYGNLWLAVVGAGLLAFGVYSLIEARYRKFGVGG